MWAGLGDIPKHVRKKSVPTKCQLEAASCKLVLRSHRVDLQNSKGMHKLSNVVFSKSCDMGGENETISLHCQMKPYM